MQGKNISTATLKSPFDISNIRVKTPYVCLVYSAQKDISKEDMERISDWLVSTGCRYAVCAGEKCSEWHDAVDSAYISSDPNYSPPESRFIMTSWHTNETLEEIIWFWLMCTDYDDNMFENYLLLVVGEQEGLVEKILNAVSKVES